MAHAGLTGHQAALPPISSGPILDHHRNRCHGPSLGLLYSMLFQLPLADFLPHVTVGLIMWNFISGAIKEGSTIFIDNEGLIKQLPAPLSVHVYRLVWRQTLFLGHNLIIWLLLILIFPRTLVGNSSWSSPACCC